MISDLVRWNELEQSFLKSFPAIIRTCIEQEEKARVMFNGAVFEIRPVIGWGFSTIEIWGPAHVPTRTTNHMPLPV